MRSLRTILSGALAATLLCALPAHARQVAGVEISEKQLSPQGELVLNGAGVRSRLMFKVYVAALYLPQKSSQAEAIIDARGPRRVSLHLLRELSADSLLDALLDGLKANQTAAELESLKTPLEQLGQVFRRIGSAREGDIVQLDIDDSSLSIRINGKPQGEIASARLGQAMLRIWLGAQPVSADLKRALLGQ